MQALIKKQQQRYKRVREELESWDELQSRLIVQFDNAAAIIQRLQVLVDAKNYGGLRSIPHVRQELVGKQMKSLELIFCSMWELMKEFNNIVRTLGKIVRDTNQQIYGGSASAAQQLKLQIGIWPSLSECLDGLKSIYEMHDSEYSLKSSIVSSLTWKCSSTDITALRKLLMDQPNIPRDEVQFIFDVIFAEEIC